MGKFFGIVIVRPLGLILMGLYSLIQNYGLSVIAFTIIVKLILLPFMYHQKKNMKKMTKVQGEAQIIQKRYAKNQAKAQEEIQKLYERENVNPMSGCLLSFITLPIMMALYYAVRQPLTYMMGLGDETINKIAQAVGYTFEKSSVNGQIELSKIVHENWDAVSSFAGEGLVNIDFNFFGLDLSAVPVLHERTHLPVVVDPSHATGQARLVAPMAAAAAACGADGIMIEVHNDPAHALCDGAQSLTPEEFSAVADQVRKIREAIQ